VADPRVVLSLADAGCSGESEALVGVARPIAKKKAGK
jgi:hypothetical protein